MAWHRRSVPDSDWSREGELLVLLPSGGHIRLGDLTGETLLEVVLEEQTAQVREVLALIRSRYLQGRVSDD